MNDDILDDLARSATRCESAGEIFENAPIAEICERLVAAAASLNKAWSGSWIGYHSNLYTQDLQPPAQGEQFDIEWGPQPDTWYEWQYEGIEEEIKSRAKVPDLAPIREAAKLARDAFKQSQQELIPTLDAVLSEYDDPVLQDIRRKAEIQPSHFSRDKFIRNQTPTNFWSRDSAAMSQLAQGITPPRHIFFSAWLAEQRSYGACAMQLAQLARHAQKYLTQKYRLKGKTMAKTDGKIFIGHGHSTAWRDLKDFIQDRLGLRWDEFNRESTAGLSNKERLEMMLDDAVFAFLVMTAEDEHADATLHARENVIHEVGLFQGRLGFRRAIVLLEDECKPFTNIDGVSQIRFPKGNIMAASEDVRRVLEREGLL
jgi:predicted nucleotide-binding protein